jgi:hypothetical protein
MHVELFEGNGIAALPKPVEEGSGVVEYGNGKMLVAGLPTFGEKAEAWIEKDIVYPPHHHANLVTPPMNEAEEARILTHPDVAAAIDATLPEIEAFERA